MNRVVSLLLLGAVAGCSRADADPSLMSDADTTLVVSSDPELRALAAELLPGLSERSGLELRHPVRVERRSREELETYLRVKLDEELPPEEAERLTRSYHLLGLAPDDLDLRRLLLAVYLEQVSGFYDPDSTALFVLDDQGPAQLRPLLLHELVHAVQDQSADLDAMTSPTLGNDRRKAAQSVIEGHATLVMMEQVFGEMQGDEVDLSRIPEVADQLRPALANLDEQFPALASAPAVVREGLLFPYLEGAAFVLASWQKGDPRGASFEGETPTSTEQILDPARALGSPRDEPTAVELEPVGAAVAYSDDLGQAEVEILLRELTGQSDADAVGWDGDRYTLINDGQGGSGLAWVSVWDDAAARDRFIARLSPAIGELPLPSTIEAVDIDDRPVALLRVGFEGELDVGLGGEGA